MRKLRAVLLAFIIFVILTIGISHYCDSYIRNSRPFLLNFNGDSRNSEYGAMDLVLDEDTALVLGSSELFDNEELGMSAFPYHLFNKQGSNFNMVLNGRGLMQSIHHAVNVGGLSEAIKNSKVVLILSPQWFTKEHLTSEKYSSRFFESIYKSFLQNENISLGNKVKVADRIEELLIADEQELNILREYRSLYLDHDKNVFLRAQIGSYNTFKSLKNKYTLWKDIKSRENKAHIGILKETTVSDINYSKLLEEAEYNGELKTTSNEFGVYDSYFYEYMAGDLKSKKNSMVDESYVESQEYSDLILFLNICKDLNIEPLLIMVPVNGFWYDYVGFPKENRQGYYDKIRYISKKYQVELADYSNREYEKYFLRDIMHLGWKGWVYLDEAIYNFYQK